MQDGLPGQFSARSCLAEDPLGYILLPKLGLAHVAARDLHALVAGLGHDGGERRVEQGGRCRQAAAQAMSAVSGGIHADAGDGSLDDAYRVVIAQAVVAGLAAPAHVDEQRAVPAATQRQPSPKRFNRADRRLRRAIDGDLLALAVLISLGAPDRHSQALTLDDLDIGEIERSDFGPAEGAAEADQQQRPVADAARRRRHFAQQRLEAVAHERRGLTLQCTFLPGDARHHGRDRAALHIERASEQPVRSDNGREMKPQGRNAECAATGQPAFGGGRQIHGHDLRVGREVSQAEMIAPAFIAGPCPAIGSACVVAARPGCVCGRQHHGLFNRIGQCARGQLEFSEQECVNGLADDNAPLVLFMFLERVIQRERGRKSCALIVFIAHNDYLIEEPPKPLKNAFQDVFM